jgi:hypothetical protein
MWTTRWDAIEATMTATVTRYAALGRLPGHPQVAVLGQAVDLLRQYADGMFNAFSAGLKNGWLTPSTEYPDDHVFWVIQDQAQNDLQVLHLAADQRLNAPHSPMLDTLNIADALAQRALTRAQAFLPAGMRAVTYFQKSSAIRVLPYANLALIGIPYSSIDYHPDLLAIPHEIGHFVFWHGVAPAALALPYQQNVQYQLSENVLLQLNNLVAKCLSETAVATPPSRLFYRWCYVWLEELFADLLGCWVAGPVSALTIQEIVLRRPRHELTTSDADHPVGILRPYTHLKALHARGSADWNACASLLQDRWLASVPAGSDRFDVLDGSDMAAEDAVKIDWTIDPDRPVDRMVSVIIDLLQSLGCVYDDWRIPTTPPETADQLKSQFEAFYQSHVGAVPLPSTPPLTGLGSLSAWAAQYFNVSAEMQSVLNNTAPASAVAASEWWPIAQGRSWTTEPINWPRP